MKAKSLHLCLERCIVGHTGFSALYGNEQKATDTLEKSTILMVGMLELQLVPENVLEVGNKITNNTTRDTT